MTDINYETIVILEQDATAYQGEADRIWLIQNHSNNINIGKVLFNTLTNKCLYYSFMYTETIPLLEVLQFMVSIEEGLPD